LRGNNREARVTGVERSSLNGLQHIVSILQYSTTPTA
jgi:hypothetical protein